jgi:three-Cys-motif partner protein
LAVLEKYLAAYTTALKNKPFELLYIDAFAGCGWREASADARRKHETAQLALSGAETAGDEVEEGAGFLEGSARVALRCQPAFNKYVFIEKKAKYCRGLEALRSDFPQQAANIEIVHGDANRALQEMCAQDWRKRRAVLFLDPYGTEVEWRTIEAIAGTKAIDLWVLFPLGGVNRMLPASGEMPHAWRERLGEIFGCRDWETVLYEPESAPLLFKDDEARRIKAGVEVIRRFFLTRLRECFAGVAAEPLVLRNSRNAPLFLKVRS